MCVVVDRERDDTPSRMEVLGCREAGLGAAPPEGGETWVVADQARDDAPSDDDGLDTLAKRLAEDSLCSHTDTLDAVFIPSANLRETW